MAQVDSETFDLEHGASSATTLTWSTAPEDKGDWTATASGAPGGEDTADVDLYELFVRTVTATSPGGDGTSSRIVDGERTTIATGTADGTTSRTITASERTITATGTGAGSSSRTVDGERTTIATASPGDGSAASVSVSRDVIYYRSTWAEASRGAASTRWVAQYAWAVPTEGGDARVLLEPLSTETDHDAISTSAQVPTAKEALEYLERAGDVDREDTAFGAFRRISRAAVDPITVTPPAVMVPPFAERTVHVTGFGADEVTADWWELSLDFGLDRPRAREPPSTSSEPTVVDESTVSVDAESTATASLKWTPSGSDLGEFLATVDVEESYSHPPSSDSMAVTVSDAPWVFDFGVPGATMNLTRENVRPISRSPASGIPSVGMTIAVDGELASAIFAAGSRVDASQIRDVPDAANVPVDPLPDEDLTVELVAPDDAEVDTGTYVLDSWSAAREAAVEEPYEFDLTLLEKAE